MADGLYEWHEAIDRDHADKILLFDLGYSMLGSRDINAWICGACSAIVSQPYKHEEWHTKNGNK
jgi:hypothetical protein